MVKSVGSPGSQYGYEMQGRARPSDFTGAKIDSGKPPGSGATLVSLAETGRRQRCKGHIKDPHSPVAYESPYDPDNCSSSCPNLAVCTLAKEGRLSHCTKEGSGAHNPSAFGEPFDPEECRGCSSYRHCHLGFEAREVRCITDGAHDPRGHDWPFSAYHACNGCPNKSNCQSAEEARKASCKIKGEMRKGPQPEKNGYPFKADHPSCLICSEYAECDPAAAEKTDG